jgi:putative glycoprotease GCP
VPLVLAIETSCDETAAALLRAPGDLLASEVFSQAGIHAQYGGVVPEVASRNHLAAVPRVVQAVFDRSGIVPADVDVFAATAGPGLPAALLVGVAHAKALAIGCGRPFLAVNHVEGHLLSPFFGRADVPPHVGLVVSGGHTLLVDVAGVGDYRVLGSTRDDAAGEAFDKVAKLLGLGYPGGIEIERLSREGDPHRYEFPRAMLHSGDFQFSFSGLKTAVRYLLERGETCVPDVCASFQDAVVDVLVEKAVAAAQTCGRKQLSLSGGVSANARLRARMEEAAGRAGIAVIAAAPELRTDNAAMIAHTAALRFTLGERSSWNADIFPSIDPMTFGALQIA